MLGFKQKFFRVCSFVTAFKARSISLALSGHMGVNTVLAVFKIESKTGTAGRRPSDFTVQCIENLHAAKRFAHSFHGLYPQKFSRMLIVAEQEISLPFQSNPTFWLANCLGKSRRLLQLLSFLLRYTRIPGLWNGSWKGPNEQVTICVECFPRILSLFDFGVKTRRKTVSLCRPYEKLDFYYWIWCPLVRGGWNWILTSQRSAWIISN